MEVYVLQKPQTIPKIVWACKTKVSQYNWQNRNTENMIEFSICKASKRTLVMTDHSPTLLEGDSFFCILGDEECESYADDEVFVEILSVAVSFDSLSCIQKTADVEDIGDKTSILLPRVISEIPKRSIGQIENLFYKIIDAYKDRGASSELICASLVLHLIGTLDDLTRQSIKSKREKYINYYAYKAESILLSQYSQRITVKSISEGLSISPNYLSSLFKSVFGIGVTDRLLEIRMKKAVDLLVEKRLSESETARLVGYDDVGHFRRRFKQYFGVSIRDYTCISKELTLYHEKPQRKE